MAGGMKTVTDDGIKRYLEMCFISGVIDNQDTFKRYKAEARKRFPDWLLFVETANQLNSKYSKEELKQLAMGKRIEPMRTKHYAMAGKVFRFAHITDSHMGSIFFHEDIWKAVVDTCNESKLDMIFHTGDITEGFNSKRVDGIYEMNHIGYASQKQFAVDNLNMLKVPVVAIDGNHDRWYGKPMGACIVADIARECDNVEYLGADMADFVLENGERPIKIRLWHGEDGSSYATSYRVQKIIESFTGGDKPNVLLCGHTHKQLYLFDRNIHCVSGGAICVQSNWMRSKKLANHTGFHIVEMEYNERGITRFTATWHPFYE